MISIPAMLAAFWRAILVTLTGSITPALNKFARFQREYIGPATAKAARMAGSKMGLFFQKNHKIICDANNDGHICRSLLESRNYLLLRIGG